MSWLDHLEPVVNVEPNLAALEFFANLMDVAELSVEERVSTPWHAFLSFVLANGGLYNQPKQSGVKFLTEAVTRIDRRNRAMAATILFLCAFVRSRLQKEEVLLTNRIVNMLLPFNVIAGVAAEARQSAGIINIERDKIPGFWCFLRACRVMRNLETKEPLIEVDLQKLADVAGPLVGLQLASWDLRPLEMRLTISPTVVYRTAENSPIDRLQLVRTYFNDERLRGRIRPLIVSNVPPKRETTERVKRR